MGLGMMERKKMARRAAKEIEDGMIVNLGIGIPSLVPNYIPDGYSVMIQAENGLLGIGCSPKTGFENENLCNAAGYPVTTVKGASYFDSAVSFGMIRKGLIDITILGSLQVSEKGDIANWIVPGKRVPGMGGAMELAQKAKKVIIVMEHVNKYGEPKIVNECLYPLTAKKSADLIITEVAVFQVDSNKGLTLLEKKKEMSVEEIRKRTACSFFVSENLKLVN
ncbi:3-oxoacid CoA-transferase subunit B [Bacillus carboniphilus]|uniref:3-oxoacid CoA-transferase subunit B n=1 Tax=Bacillus carboniphilus TaxID=86663 RepID=A0ABY9JY01_9BACI|nr:3-oxoacid CoA-transferase subunit B [Bacillus carboniphilus]WLR43320.1 3-oxoacid CoA-transferase subunit B [Bacillus carboniphilus]